MQRFNISLNENSKNFMKIKIDPYFNNMCVKVCYKRSGTGKYQDLNKFNKIFKFK